MKNKKNLNQALFKLKFLLSEFWNSGKHIREAEREMERRHKKFEQDLQEIMKMEGLKLK